MKKRKGVTPTFKELLADLKPMTFSQKLDHLWSYYKEYLLVVFLIGIVIAIIISSILNGQKKYVFQGMIINISMTSEGYRYVTDDLLAELSDGSKNQHVLFDYTNFTSLADPTSGEDNYNATMVLIARVSAGQVDAALVDQLALEFYIGQEVFGDLRTCFTDEQLAAMGTDVWHLVMDDGVEEEEEDEEDEEDETDPEDPDKGIPMAICVSDMPFFRDCAPNNEKIYLVVSANEPNREAVQGLWEHLNAWPKAS